MILGQWHTHMSNDEAGALPHTIIKINSIWTANLKVNYKRYKTVWTKTIKFSEENRVVNISDLGLDKIFLDMMSKA